MPTTALVEARELTGVARRGGIGSYIRGLLSGLAEVQGVRVLALATADAELPAGIERRQISRIFPDRQRAAIEHAFRLPIDVARSHADVFHNTSPHAPAAIRKPWVQTLHDVIPLVDQDPTLAPQRRRWARFGPRYRHADAIIAVSRFSADDGIRHLGLDTSRIHVIHHGVGPGFRPDGPTVDALPFLLLVSEFSLRKGYAEAIDVIGMVAEAGFPHTLKLVGRVEPKLQPSLDAVLAKASRPDRVEIAGYVDDIAALYRSAAVVLVLSRYEGFGLPAAEAMACGAPLVAFDNSSLPEIVGTGGVLIPDGDTAAAAAAVVRILKSPEYAADLRGRAVERAAAFTWPQCAQRTAEVYTAVAHAG